MPHGTLGAMEDFASATLVRLLARGMAAHGRPVPLAEPVTARVLLADKRLLVQAAIAGGGLAGLLRLAGGIGHVEGEPVHQALIGARDPHDFMGRWQRLERYVHASHQVRVQVSAPAALQLAHGARDAARPQDRPLAAESVAVLGLLIGCFEAIGVHGLAVHAGGRRVFPAPVEDDLQTLARAGALSHWHLHWCGVVARRPRKSDRDTLCDPLPWPAPAHRIARWVLADTAAPRRLADAARELGTSARSLQRALAAEGLGYTGVVAEARARAAAWWLMGSDHGVAEIGFLCGYADQAHFTREFARRAGMPPAAYRRSVGATAAPAH